MIEGALSLASEEGTNDWRWPRERLPSSLCGQKFEGSQGLYLPRGKMELGHSDSQSRKEAAMIWRAGGYEWRFPRPMLIMGVLNVTPDSFSDGGRFLDPERAVDRAWEMLEEGADLVDIGGESTRPFSDPVPVEEELRRVVPVLRRLSGRFPVPISIDTRKPEVAQVALDLGACVVNDINAGQQRPEMWQLVARYRAGYICMHMKGTPKTMQVAPEYQDVVAEVHAFFVDRLRILEENGIDPSQVVLDPGIGFGKTVRHNLALLSHISRFNDLGRPILIGVSRKSFLGALLEAPIERRLAGSLACACWAAERGVGIVRAHDVEETRHAVRIIEALQQAQNKEAS